MLTIILHKGKQDKVKLKYIGYHFQLQSQTKLKNCLPRNCTVGAYFKSQLSFLLYRIGNYYLVSIYIYDWGTLLYSRKLTELCKPTIMEKIKVIFKKSVIKPQVILITAFCIPDYFSFVHCLFTFFMFSHLW